MKAAVSIFVHRQFRFFERRRQWADSTTGNETMRVAAGKP
jgi:hypothetical protein